MKNAFCSSCNRQTGFKRALGWGTFFACILTGGLWLLTIPFYPKRCVICANKTSKENKEKKEISFERIGKVLIGFAIFIVAMTIISGINQLFSKSEKPQDNQISAKLQSKRKAAVEKFRKEFTENRASFMAQLDASYQKKDYKGVISKARPYLFIEDNELKSMYKKSVKQAFLKSSFFGDWSNARRISKSGNIHLKIWGPYLEYANEQTDIAKQTLLRDSLPELNIMYDEIWEKEVDYLLTSEEKRRYRGKLDRAKLYWKNGEVQAFTIEGLYDRNPVTGARISSEFRIKSINNKDTVINNLIQFE
ncbi:MAG: hypothetical protein HYV24_00245 [Deltaproteobacteria bacterium]|nr:hypothetical protein [Deltaproteobacteria bacterium]